ncbi:MAG: ribosome small subunit-dependent GTPase A [Gemmatimonadetes bacterium]|nr:ribosome small subunit-dependent GTPase A [Gemmatimonadota bacterium]
MKGTVYGSQGGVYLTRLDSGEFCDASLRGRLKQEVRTGDRVVIGDRVEVATRKDGTATIESVHDRRSQIIRKGPGGRRPKVVAANVDRLVVVASATRPEPRQLLLDRLLVIGESNDLDPVLVMNKIDLVASGSPEVSQGQEAELPIHSRLLRLYRGIGYHVLETSALTGEGMSELESVLCSGTSALLGPSGVGKSTLLNTVQPGLGLRTGELSHKKGRGRHTTVSARLIPMECGGLVADTPGFSDVGVWGVDQRDLEGCFPDFHPFRGECQFRGCTHLHEPNCGVQAALARAEIDPSRFESYRSLVQEGPGPSPGAPHGS